MEFQGSQFIGLTRILSWPLRLLLERFGVTPKLILGFGTPFDNAAEPDATFLHLPVLVRRQRWRGETQPILHCGVRLRLRGDREVDRQGVWWASTQAPLYFALDQTLYEGYVNFHIPLILQHTRKSYLHDYVEPGTYLADYPLMHPGMGDSALRLAPGLFRIGVDLIAGARIQATSEWLLIVTGAPSLAIQRAITDEADDSELRWFRLTPESTD